MNRRQFLGTTGVTLSAAALGAPYVSTGRAQGASPIRIGLLAPLTGVVASGGREMVEGTRFRLSRSEAKFPAARWNC